MISFRGNHQAIQAKRRRQRANLNIESLERRDLMTALLWQIGSNSFDLGQTFQLHSNPGAKQVVYLDFDGHNTTNDPYWGTVTSGAWDYSNNGSSFTTTEQQIIQKIWARVAEDFAPFNIDVTTEDPGVEALRKTGTTDDRWGKRVVITPDDAPAPGAGGVAYLGSFNYATDTPAYVFNEGEKSVAEATSHEVGHTLNLDHDGTASQEYYGGQGSGATSWGPIMGASYNPIVTQWSKGEYSGANNREDDLNLITTANGFTYRSDDFGGTQSGAFALLPQGSTDVAPVYALIERNTDADYFSFWSNAGDIALSVNPLPLGPNLAVRADLYNASGVLLTTVNPANALNADVNFTLPSNGQYFLKVTGTGKGSASSTGFSNYASLGNYRITGSVVAYTDVGPTNNAPVALNDVATTIADTAVTINVLTNDSDPDGDTFTITDVTGVQNGTAVISGSSVIFTPTAGFTGTGSFTYSISDGKGGTASATATITVNDSGGGGGSTSFTNDTNFTISSFGTSTNYSIIFVSGVSGTIQDVNVKVNIFHNYDSDLTITVIAPDGTRIRLFNRNGGSGDNILGTTFDSSASIGISSGRAPFTGTFRPSQSLNTLNGKSADGFWTLEVRDNHRRDGGYFDSWSLDLKTTDAAAKSAGLAVDSAKTVTLAGLDAFLSSAGSSANSFGSLGTTHVFSQSPLVIGRTAQTVTGPVQNLGNSLSGCTGPNTQSLFEELFGASPEGDLPAAPDGI